MTLAPGSRLGPYEILALIGRGGMGEVYRAADQRLGREVAIKVLPSELADHPESLARFRREARAVAALSHPNIVAIFDVGTEPTPFVVTELLDGETLRERLDREPLRLEEALRISAGIAAGLEAAHAKGIIHRDLKPENVFLTSGGGVKILDFGLASRERRAGPADETSRTEMLTEPGMVMGTVGYMSPEQLRGKPLTTATDVFSFGCVAYEMFAGEMPFHRESRAEMIASVLLESPFDRLAAGTVRPDVREILEGCLAKEPAERFAAEELVGALREVLGDFEARRTTERTRVTRVRRRARASPRRTVIIGLLILAAAAVLAVASFYFAGRNQVIDGGYDLRASDVSADREARRLTALGLRADAAGNRSEAIELCREAARIDPHAPLPAAFVASFVYYSGDRKEGERWSAETRKRLGGSSRATYEALLSRFLLPDNDGATMLALASSMLELRPKAWRLRLSIAHRHLDRREMKAMLADLRQIDVSAPDDRRLTVVLSDRASLGDIDGAERDLMRSRLVDRPALLAHTRGRIAWSRGRAAEAARQFEAAAESATIGNLPPVACDSLVLAGVAQIGAGDLEAAQATLDRAAVTSRRASLPQSELEAHGFGAYVAWRLSDAEGMERRLRAAVARSEPGSMYDAALRLFMLRAGARTPPPAADTPLEIDVGSGVGALLAAREAWSRGDENAATRLLQQARSEGIDASWFSEDAALLAYDLGAPPRAFRPDPPYPNRLRFIAVWELSRPRRPAPAPQARLQSSEGVVLTLVGERHNAEVFGMKGRIAFIAYENERNAGRLGLDGSRLFHGDQFVAVHTEEFGVDRNILKRADGRRGARLRNGSLNDLHGRFLLSVGDEDHSIRFA